MIESSRCKKALFLIQQEVWKLGIGDEWWRWCYPKSITIFWRFQRNSKYSRYIKYTEFWRNRVTVTTFDLSIGLLKFVDFKVILRSSYFFLFSLFVPLLFLFFSSIFISLKYLFKYLQSVKIKFDSVTTAYHITTSCLILPIKSFNILNDVDKIEDKDNNKNENDIE